MRYIPSSAEDRRQMLKAIGRQSIEELLAGIPHQVRLQGPLRLPPPLSEPELLAKFKSFEQKNENGFLSFLGAGVNAHFIPTIIDSLISRAEFLTSYTPYQAEISQGTLQATFEFQTYMCQLTGMEVSNASMYDGSTALAEALLMAARLTQRRRFLIAKTIHPEYRWVLDTHLKHQALTVDTIDFGENGTVDLTQVKEKLQSDVSALVVQSPNFFGNLEPLREAAALAHGNGSLLVVNISEALSLGVVTPPGTAGADIVCGEAQSLGVPASFGGPHVGFLTTREKFVRNMPGRLVGQTTDSEGNRGFVLTLSTREQHIRREKATSNICTNQSLYALVSTIYCSLLGQSGIREVAAQNVSKTHYAISQIAKLTTVKNLFPGCRFNEFVVKLESPFSKITERSYRERLVPGLHLGVYFPALKDCLLISVTETKSKADIDRLVQVLGEK